MKEELKNVFFSESRDLLKSMEERLSVAEDRPQAIAELFRCAHMLKGNARFAGFQELELIVGGLTEIFRAAKTRGAFERSQLPLLRESVTACEDVLEGKTVAGYPGLVGRLNRAAAALSAAGPPRSAVRVLMIEDSDLQTQIIRDELEGSRGPKFSIEVVDSLDAGLRRLTEGGIDAVLLDLNLPDSQGLETFSKLHAHAPDVPVVILTISDDDAAALEALSKGAQDYLVKSHLGGQLLSRVIRYAIERNRVERNLRRAQDRLETRVQERTAELTKANEALREKSSALERSNSELALFASSASHEFQAPLRKIVAWCELLARQGSRTLSPEGLEHLRNIQNAALHLGDIITSIGELTQVTTQAKPFTPVPLEEVLKVVLSDLGPALAESRGRVVVGKLPSVMADAVQMRELFDNLVGNAVKYRSKDRALLVEVGGRDNGSGSVEVFVRDNGIGFDPKYEDRIFKPFHRLHGSGEYEGIGMGLTICSRIVARHGGTISARGRPGEGAEFTVSLPAAKAGGA